jgi:hypothetical protein
MSGFCTDSSALMVSFFEEKPDVIMCFTLRRIPLFDALSSDSRIMHDYAPAHYMSIVAILNLEKRDLEKTSLTISTKFPLCLWT